MAWYISANKNGGLLDVLGCLHGKVIAVVLLASAMCAIPML